MRHLAALAAVGALAAAAAACHDSVGPGACFEPNATAYFFNVPGDTNGVFHWPSSSMPVRVYAEPVGELQRNVDSTMVLWVNAFRCGELSLSRVADSVGADIVLRNPTSLPPIPPAPTPVSVAADSINACRGRTDVQLDTLGRIQRPIRSYVAPQGIDSAATAACYHFVVAHEFGHALGLFQHSPDPLDLLYSTPRRRALTANDRYTVQLLYHTPPTFTPTPR